MRKSFVACCACLLMFSTIEVSDAEAGRVVVRSVARGFSRSLNQVQRNYRQASRVQQRVYRAPVRRLPAYRAPVYHAPVYYGPSHRTRYHAPVYGSGIYFGSPRGGIYLNF